MRDSEAFQRGALRLMRHIMMRYIRTYSSGNAAHYLVVNSAELADRRAAFTAVRRPLASQERIKTPSVRPFGVVG
jgi:hypothetical protein